MVLGGCAGHQGSGDRVRDESNVIVVMARGLSGELAVRCLGAGQGRSVLRLGNRFGP